MLKIVLCKILLSVSLLTSSLVFAEELPVNPKDALQRLMDGNERFTNDKTICPERNQERRIATASQQKPFAIIVGCSDSRVPPEVAFDQGIGDIFVVRVAGNVVAPVELDSIEYSVVHNGSSIIMVLGHERCGAVSAVLDNKTKDIEDIAKLIKPAVQDAKGNLEQAIKANVYNSIKTIKKSPVISKYLEEGKIDIVGGYYSFDTGKIRLLPST